MTTSIHRRLLAIRDLATNAAGAVADACEQARVDAESTAARGAIAAALERAERHASKLTHELQHFNLTEASECGTSTSAT